MKIVHICLACFYVEGMGYQENLLPKYHVKQGHQVTVLTNDYSFNKNYKTEKKALKNYVNKDNVKVKVLNRTSRYGWYSRFGDYEGIIESLYEENPDVIFVHGGQFIGLKDVIKYCKNNRSVKLYIDQHADYYNTNIKSFKKKIAHKYIYGHWIRKACKYAERFWGVTPWRCEFLKDVYSLPKKKIDLLVMGADDEYVDLKNKNNIRDKIRKQYDIKDDDFLIVTGGKIDKAKNILNLMQAINGKENVKLLVFGSLLEDAKQEFNDILSKSKNVIYIGWLDSNKVYDYFLSADLAVFPGTHSVLWEQACACKVPCLFKRWEGMEHVNNGGNSDFIDDVSSDGIRLKIEELLFTEKYYKMKEHAESEKTDIYLYSNIAEKSLESYNANK